MTRVADWTIIDSCCITEAFPLLVAPQLRLQGVSSDSNSSGSLRYPVSGNREIASLDLFGNARERDRRVSWDGYLALSANHQSNVTYRYPSLAQTPHADRILYQEGLLDW